MIFKRRYIWIGLFFLTVFYLTMHTMRQMAEENRVIHSDPCLDRYNECEVKCFYSNKGNNDAYLICDQGCNQRFLNCPAP